MNNKKVLANKKSYYTQNKADIIKKQTNSNKKKAALKRAIKENEKINNNSKMSDQTKKFIEKLLNKLTFGSKVLCINKAEKIVNWCLIGQKNDYCSFKRTLQTLKNQAEGNRINYNSCNSKNEIEEKVTALCGISKHNASTEAFYADTANKFSDLLICNKTNDTLTDNSNEVIVNGIIAEEFNAKLNSILF